MAVACIGCDLRCDGMRFVMERRKEAAEAGVHALCIQGSPIDFRCRCWMENGWRFVSQLLQACSCVPKERF
jgi:hypothetical protein